MSDFWLGVVTWKNAKHLKKDRQRINASTIASLKMVKFLHDRRWEKRNRINFYRVTLLVCINENLTLSMKIMHKNLI